MIILYEHMIILLCFSHVFLFPVRPIQNWTPVRAKEICSYHALDLQLGHPETSYSHMMFTMIRSFGKQLKLDHFLRGKQMFVKPPPRCRVLDALNIRIVNVNLPFPRHLGVLNHHLNIIYRFHYHSQARRIPRESINSLYWIIVIPPLWESLWWVYKPLGNKINKVDDHLYQKKTNNPFG